ncbi:MAG: hypothetical protein FWE14_11215 [Lachnospiraceae bacterium]|nr:hypothetical protein [Lachnospiraceae bacterium]
MATDEEYLDSLLKSIMEDEPKSEADVVMPEIAAGEELPVFEEELPAFEEELPSFEEELASFEDELPSFEDELPSFEGELPGSEEELPVFEEESPVFGDELPNFEDEIASLGDELPAFEEELPSLENELASFENEQPASEEELPAFEDELVTEDLKLAGEPLIDYEELTNFSGSLVDDEVDLLSLGGMPSADEMKADTSGDDEEAKLSDFDLDAMFAEMDENIELPEEAAAPFGDDDFSTAAQMEDMEIGDLLAGMSDDEDLSGIKDLLDKDDNHELVDDDMLALLDGMPGYSDEGEDLNDVMALLTDPGASEEPKKKAKQKKKRGRSKDSSDEEFALSPEDIDAQLGKKKKKSIISRLFAALTESDDESDEIDVQIQTISAENLDILDELKAEDGKVKKKTKKDKKEKKVKPPKEPKVKKPKKEKPPKEPAVPEKRVSRKKVLLVFIFSTSLLAVIIAFCLLIPDYLEREEAKIAYKNEDHRSIFSLLYAKNRGYSDEIIFQQSQLIMRINRPLESYNIYKSLDKPVEALNALLIGINRYDGMKEENLFGTDLRVNTAYQEILRTLSAGYNLSEDEARSILALDSESYTRKLYELTMGIDFSEIGE